MSRTGVTTFIPGARAAAYRIGTTVGALFSSRGPRPLTGTREVLLVRTGGLHSDRLRSLRQVGDTAVQDGSTVATVPPGEVSSHAHAAASGGGVRAAVIVGQDVEDCIGGGERPQTGARSVEGPPWRVR
jgi:hypothetical protein